MNANSPKVGAGVVIVKGGKTLLAKRKGSHGEGRWGSMGGHVEFGESPIETVKREAREELGIEIDNVRFITVMNMVRDGQHYVDISFVADHASGDPRPLEPDKIEAVGWFALDELPEPLFDPVRVVLEALQSGQTYFEVAE